MCLIYFLLHFSFTMSVSVIAKPYTLCTESLKSITSGVAKQHEPSFNTDICAEGTPTSNLFTVTEKKSQVPENATDEDSRGQSHACLKVMFLCGVLLVYLV